MPYKEYTIVTNHYQILFDLIEMTGDINDKFQIEFYHNVNFNKLHSHTNLVNKFLNKFSKFYIHVQLILLTSKFVILIYKFIWTVCACS